MFYCLFSFAKRPIKVISVYTVFFPLLAIKGPRLAKSILFQSSGLTNGIIEERDIPEELPRQTERKQEEGKDKEDMVSDEEIVDCEEADVSVFEAYDCQP